MASVDKRPDGRWRARWREYPGGPQHARHFDRKATAERFLVEIAHQLQVGAYVNPAAGAITLADYVAEWLTRRHWRPATRDRIENELRRHILPSLGHRRLTAIRRSDIEGWAASLRLAPATVRTTTATLAAILASAVDDSRIAKNPATRARLPQPEHAPVVPLDSHQIRELVAAVPEVLRAGAVLAAGTGLRQSEAMAITLDRVDFPRRLLAIDRQLDRFTKGAVVFAPPKSRRSYRTLALSGIVLDSLSAHVAAYGAGPEGLVFHRRGGCVTRDYLTWSMRTAARRAGLVGATWHDFRHHHASVLLSQGVSPALVAERLGHDIGTLLRTYAHVIRSDEDRVRALVDEGLGGSAEDWLRTTGTS